tara:strand:+ start:385 stop:549 length:165 start_codon:yes stop_codon:yes gene_type:complete
MERQQQEPVVEEVDLMVQVQHQQVELVEVAQVLIVQVLVQQEQLTPEVEVAEMD